MRHLLHTCRGASLLLLILMSLAVGSQASTLSYYIDIFGAASWVPPGGASTPLPMSSLMTLLTTPPPGATKVSPGSATLNIPRFDQTIPGDPYHVNVLTQVQFDLAAIISAVAFVDNTGSLPGTINSLQASIPITVSQSNDLSCVGVQNCVTQTVTAVGATNQNIGPATHHILTQAFMIDHGLDCGTDFGGTTLPSGDCQLPGITPTRYTSPATTATGNSSTIITTGLGAFQAPGGGPAIPFYALVGNVTESAEFSSTSDVNHLSSGGVGTAGGILQVTYTYETVGIPEPTTMFLVGSAFVGWVIRRRKQVWA